MDKIDKRNIQLPRIVHRLKDPVTGHECVYPIGMAEDSFATAMKHLSTYKGESDDVWVCSVPKSGTTWTEYIVWLIMHEGRGFPEGKSMEHVIPQAEFEACEINNLPRPRIIKTHLERKLLPISEKAKYIYVARNPKDVIVSYLFHCRGFASFGAPDLRIEELIDSMAYGEISFGNHCENVAEWYKVRNDENVLFLLYEEMKADLKGNVIKIAKFLGKSEMLLKDDERLLKEIVEKSTFASMSKLKDSNWLRNGRKGSTKFVRKGIVGDHLNHLSRSQTKTFDDALSTKYKKFGINHLWES